MGFFYSSIAGGHERAAKGKEMEEINNEASEQETPVHEMAVEDIQSLLTDGPKSEPVSEPVKEDVTPEPQPTSTAPAQEEPVKATPPEPDYKTVVEELRRKTENQDALLARLGTELGLLRKAAPEEERQKLQEIRDLYLEDPVAGQDAYEAYKVERTQLAIAQREAQLAQYEAKTKEELGRYTNDFETAINDIGEVLTADKVPADIIADFKRHPYRYPPDFLHSLQQRAKLTKVNSALASENAQLKAKVADLEKKPDSLLQRIEQASRQRGMTAKTGGAATVEIATPNNQQIHELSQEELRKLAYGG